MNPEFDPRQIRIEEYSYHLPQERIARFPLKQRDMSKLLVYANGRISHGYFYQLPEFLPSHSLLAVNNTKVVHARLIFHKPTGAKIEIFLLNPVEPSEYSLAFEAKGKARWACLVGNLKKWKQGTLTKTFELAGTTHTLNAEIIAKQSDNVVIEFRWPENLTFSQVIERVGLVPIPPYLNREPTEQDRFTYQTVYSKYEGSVAAPTAGLHFTPRVLDKLKAKAIEQAEVTLHVGAGTFRPVKSPTIGEHTMHTEYFTVTRQELAKLRKYLGNITAVGTTTLRTLESLYWLGHALAHGEPKWFVSQWQPYDTVADVSAAEAFDVLLSYLERTDKDRVEGWTQLFIVPGYEFKVVDRLITNFHQPQSTLLLLVAAFVGPVWREIYEYALSNDFRFLSYGDSSLLYRS